MRGEYEDSAAAVQLYMPQGLTLGVLEVSRVCLPLDTQISHTSFSWQWVFSVGLR